METLESQLESQRRTANYDYDKDLWTKSIHETNDLTHPVSGDNAPMFVLPDENGNQVNLEEILKDGPVILSFFKGDFCSYCDLELKALQRALPQFQKYGAVLVGISPHTVSISYDLKEQKNLSYSILSDTGNEIAEKFGLRFKMAQELVDTFASFGLDDMATVFGESGENTTTVPIPGTFVIGMNGEIVFAFVDSDHTKRAEPADIVACLMSLN